MRQPLGTGDSTNTAPPPQPWAGRPGPGHTADPRVSAYAGQWTAAPDNAVTRASQISGPHERLLACAEIWPSPDLPRARWWRRPRVLRGLRMPGDRWEGVKDRSWAALKSLGWPFRKLEAFFDWLFSFGGTGADGLHGGRDSTAGRFAAALQPRSRTTGVTRVLQLTDQRLRLVYVQRGRRSNLYGAVEAGWEVPAAQVAWLERSRSGREGALYHIGFVDGSWAGVSFEEARPGFVDVLPAPAQNPPPGAGAGAGAGPSFPPAAGGGLFPHQSGLASPPVEWSGYTGTKREVVVRAAGVLPDGERLLASHHLAPGYRMRRPRRGRRPLVFDGLRMPGDRRRGFWRGVGNCLMVGFVLWTFLLYPFQFLFDALTEWYPRGKGRALGGGWNSHAGAFAAALHPRARTTDATYVAQLTDRHLRVTYVQCARVEGSQLGAAQPGFVLDRARVAWLRARPDVSRTSYEFGFVDGSWARVALHAPRRHDFVGQFPVGPPR